MLFHPCIVAGYGHKAECIDEVYSANCEALRIQARRVIVPDSRESQWSERLEVFILFRKGNSLSLVNNVRYHHVIYILKCRCAPSRAPPCTAASGPDRPAPLRARARAQRQSQERGYYGTQISRMLRLSQTVRRTRRASAQARGRASQSCSSTWPKFQSTEGSSSGGK